MRFFKTVFTLALTFSLGLIALAPVASAQDRNAEARLRLAASNADEGAIGLLLLFGALAEGANRNRREQTEREVQEERHSEASEVLAPQDALYDDYSGVCIAYEDIPADQQVCEAPVQASGI